MFSFLFHPVHGAAWYGYVIGGLIFSVAVFFLLQLVPQHLRRYVIQAVTFLAGLYFALEFFWPTHPTPTAEDPQAVGNWLTPGIVPLGNYLNAIAAWTIGLGVINLCQVHGKRLMKGSEGAFNSLAFFISMILMFILGILAKVHPNNINKNLYDLLFSGALTN